MGGWFSKTEVVETQQQIQGENTITHYTLSAITLGIIIIILIVISCFYLIKKFRNHIVHTIHRNAQVPV